MLQIQQLLMSQRLESPLQRTFRRHPTSLKRTTRHPMPSSTSPQMTMKTKLVSPPLPSEIALSLLHARPEKLMLL